MLALVGFAVMVARQRARVGTPVAVGGGDAPSLAPQPAKSSFVARMGRLTMNMVESGGHWPAFIVGLGSTVPPVEGPMILTVIMGSRATARHSIQCLHGVHPSGARLHRDSVDQLPGRAAENRSRDVDHPNRWIIVYRRQIVESMLAVTGVVMLVQGVSGL